MYSLATLLQKSDNLKKNVSKILKKVFSYIQ